MAMRRILSYREFDWWLLAMVLLLCTISVFEIYSATLHTKYCLLYTSQKDYLFAGVTNDCIAVNLGGTGGCILSLDITNGFPTVNAASTAYAASGGTTGIVVDNDSSATEASSVYYATKSGGTLVKATQNGLD